MLALVWGWVVAGCVGALERPVRVGYWQGDPNPLHVGIARGWFDDGDDRVVFYPLNSGALASAKLEAGDLDVVIVGSAPFSKFTARGLDLVTIYVQYEIGVNEALAVKSDRVESPLDLDGTTMCTPAGSTMDYHLSSARPRLRARARAASLTETLVGLSRSSTPSRTSASSTPAVPERAWNCGTRARSTARSSMANF